MVALLHAGGETDVSARGTDAFAFACSHLVGLVVYIPLTLSLDNTGGGGHEGEDR